jgi:hypothetical protein
MSKFVAGEDASNKENLDPDETNDWLHRNDSQCAQSVNEPVSTHFPGDLNFCY